MRKQALLSVSDKTGIVEFARGLVEAGYHILSTGGTAKLLASEGIDVQEVADYTGFPEMLDGRVKTLNPKIHAGILARRPVPEHMAALKEHGIDPIDIVCVNLYPFEQTVARPDCTLEEAIENIDIGGPTMIRAAAKNCESVAVVVYFELERFVLWDYGENVVERREFAVGVFFVELVGAHEFCVFDFFGGQLAGLLVDSPVFFQFAPFVADYHRAVFCKPAVCFNHKRAQVERQFYGFHRILRGEGRLAAMRVHSDFFARKKRAYRQQQRDKYELFHI